MRVPLSREISDTQTSRSHSAVRDSETISSHVESYLKKGIDVLGDNMLGLWLVLTIDYVHVQSSLLGVKRRTEG